jgi:penicillin G amidase
MRIVLGVILAIVLLVVLTWFGGPLYLKRSVALYDGTVATTVQSPVEIVFDAKGVPQIWAQTDHDAWFAMGWVHGSERLFQMELLRRLARGELAEVFGDAAYETDVFQRRIGYARRSGDLRISSAERAVLQRYADGVNEAIRSARLLPPEFLLLRVRPRPWTVEDSLAITLYQSWFSHELADKDARYQALVERIGPAADALTVMGHPWSPPTVPSEFSEGVLGATRMLATAASNSWVISPDLSASGFALHASDPHLAVHQAPGLWYLAGLHSQEGLNIVGVTVPGLPFVLMGHNGQVAFSFTVAGVDLIDYYDDSPAGPSFPEEIHVKGEGSPRLLEVRHGIRGVMIDEKLSLHWAGFDTIPDVSAMISLQKAGTFDDFRRAVTSFGALDTNWIYSDREGNIGYQLGAPIPIRDFNSFRRQNALDPATAWRGYRPIDQTPHALNPSNGYLASCNNQIVSEDWHYPIPGFYDPYRIVRATEFLDRHAAAFRTSGARVPVQLMHDMQLDVVSARATRWKSLAAAGARAARMEDEADSLETWDGAMGVDSHVAALFASWWHSLARAVFEDELGEKWEDGTVLLEVALTSGSPLIDDRRTPGIETVTDIAARAIVEARKARRGRTWGEMSRHEVNHPLGRVKLLDRWLALSRGPFPAAGDGGSLKANFHSYDRASESFRSRIGPSMRFVLDWSDPDSFSLTGALGQSGNPLSPHYDDFLSLMQRGESWNVPFSRAKVLERKAKTLTLVPQEARARSAALN